MFKPHLLKQDICASCVNGVEGGDGNGVCDVRGCGVSGDGGVVMEMVESVLLAGIVVVVATVANPMGMFIGRRW